MRGLEGEKGNGEEKREIRRGEVKRGGKMNLK